MLDERLFYFIHGFCTMFFLVSGLHRIQAKESSRLERLCGYVLLYWCFLEVKDLTFYTSVVFRNNYLSNLLILVDMTAVPAGCCFVIEVLNHGWCTLRRTLLLASPFIAALLLYALTAAQWVVDLSFPFIGCYAVGFLCYTIFAVRRYNRTLSDNYSNIEHLHIHWLKRVAALLLICLALWVTSCYYSSWITDSIYQLVLLLLWVLTLHYTKRQQSMEIAPATAEKGHREGEPNEESNAHFALVLDRLIHEERIWLNPHLTLSDLAMQVGTNRSYLSNYLNNTLHTTFYDYINSFRLQAALHELHNPHSTATMVEIAERCGFNSLSTFRRVFMRATGCSFIEYRHQLEQNREE